ncbi:hypothetical protein KHP62_00735 [Rhodobacteraceae bacterium NNCM2]|nr:hypothetical protein [Coraliihabitans acroporae]
MLKLTDHALAHIRERRSEEEIAAYRKSANERKRIVYWIGFLEGALSSKRIEVGEETAILAEADKFQEFFDDPDASDLADDIRAQCFSSETDMMIQLGEIIFNKREEMFSEGDHSEADELNEFLGFCAGIICDGRILDSEVRAIVDRFRQSEVLMKAAPFQRLRRAVDAAIADNVITDDEAGEIQEWIAELVGDGFIDTGLPNIGSVSRLDDPITDPSEVEIVGSNFVLTGPMRMGPRAFIQSEIECAGGFLQAGPKKTTDFVVISARASKHWKTTHFGGKIERAKELIDQGHKVRFVSEVALEKAIEMSVRP